MKQVALLTVPVLLLCLSILLLRPSSPPVLLSLQTSNSDRRLSVFLSDLPRALNYGLLDLYWSLPAADSRIPASSDPDHPAPRTRPPYPNNPLIKQYSAEYWLLASLRPDSASANSSVRDDTARRQAVQPPNGDDPYAFTMSSLTTSMCWKMVKTKDKLNQVGMAIYQKPMDNNCYEKRSEDSPPLCKETDDADAAWNVPLQACMHKLPVGPSVRGSKWPETWPQRLEKTPYWIDGSHVGVYGKPGNEDFEADYAHWKRVVSKSYVNGMGIGWSKVRNVMDMRAVYGGCKLLAVFAEVDRILRPEGKLIVRDNAETINELEGMAKSLQWEVRMTYTKGNEGLLCVQKSMWRPKEIEAST